MVLIYYRYKKVRLADFVSAVTNSSFSKNLVAFPGGLAALA
jgi:hypothetical protein